MASLGIVGLRPAAGTHRLDLGLGDGHRLPGRRCQGTAGDGDFFGTLEDLTEIKIQPSIICSKRY